MKSVQTTTSVVPAERQCPRCGVKLGGFGPEGLCGACLIDSGLAEEESVPALGEPASQLRRLGGYELLEEIARGGMGVVYRARQVSLNRIVAVKMILRGGLAGADELARFHKEAEAAAHLKHPNIVGIHEVGEHEGQHFFSMELVEGRSLSALVREGPLPAAQAARYVEKIARAVHYAHEQGVLHRDLKPSNVLVDGNDEPHVTDFGLAKRLSNPELETRNPELTLTGMVMGTPSFMPPEQAAPWHDQIGPRSDVYSLGAILYHLLTGRPPFAGPDAHAILNQVLKNEVVAARLLNPSIPRDLETIALKCLEKEPGRRYASARALAEDLSRFLNHEPILAAPPSAVYRASKFVRRHRVAVAVAAAFVVLLTAATAISVRFGLRANRERELALQAKTATEKAEREATRRADEASTVLGFLRKHVLAAARPEGQKGGLGHEVTLRRAVEAAEPRIASLFSNQPAVEAEVRQALGETFMYLADFTNAIRQFKRVMDLAESNLGRTHPKTLVIANALASAYADAGGLIKAIALLQDVVGAQEAKTSASPEGISLVISTKNNLATMYADNGQLTLAIPLMEEVLKWKKEHLGEENPDTLVTMNNLGTEYTQAGRPEDGLALLRRVLEIREARLERGHPDILVSMQNLANACRRTGNISEAFSLLEKVIEESFHKLGPLHAGTLLAKNNLGLAYMDNGEPAKALSYFKEAMEGHAAGYGDAHPHTLTMMNNFASAHEQLGQLDEALQLRKRAVELSTAKWGAEAPRTLSLINSLAVTLHASGNLPEAILLLENAVKLMKISPVARDVSTIRAMQDLANLYLLTNRLADAEIVLQDVLRFQRSSARGDSASLADTLSQLGGLLLRQEKFAESEPYLRQALPIYEKKLPGRSLTFQTKGLLGWSLLEQKDEKDYAEAEQLLTESYEGLAKRQAEQPSRSRSRFLKETAARLVKMYDALGKPDEATKWREKAR